VLCLAGVILASVGLRTSPVIGIHCPLPFHLAKSLWLRPKVDGLQAEMDRLKIRVSALHGILPRADLEKFAVCGPVLLPRCSRHRPFRHRLTGTATKMRENARFFGFVRKDPMQSGTAKTRTRTVRNLCPVSN
jgi:hypothetical protein